jgi:membrane fusion protein (multidrug efflux system)
MIRTKFESPDAAAIRLPGSPDNAQNTVYQTNVFDKYGDEANAEIARIIAENAGSPPRLAQR